MDRVENSGSAILAAIHHYDSEAGVASLEGEIATPHRKLARELARSGKRNANPELKNTGKTISRRLGIVKFHFGMAEKADEIGLANGFAWTEIDGEILSTEVLATPLTINLILTGKLGKVTRRPARAALRHARSISTTESGAHLLPEEIPARVRRRGLSPRMSPRPALRWRQA
ncbi:MAG: hypothetical protein LBO66_00910 [Deltaproteobacteria bacterium]|nr:hypothetical protein [Deltaproteobacteria bacterium]